MAWNGAFRVLSLLGCVQAINQATTEVSAQSDADLESIISDHKAQWASIADQIRDLEEVIQTQKDLSQRLRALAETTKLGKENKARESQTKKHNAERMYPWIEEPGPFRLQSNCTHIGAHNFALNFSFQVRVMQHRTGANAEVVIGI